MPKKKSKAPKTRCGGRWTEGSQEDRAAPLRLTGGGVVPLQAAVGIATCLGRLIDA